MVPESIITFESAPSVPSSDDEALAGFCSVRTRCTSSAPPNLAASDACIHPHRPDPPLVTA